MPSNPERTLRQGVFLLALVLAVARPATADMDEALQRALSSAEGSLREGKPSVAAGHYGRALLEAWLLSGTLEMAEGRNAQARDSFGKAAAAGPRDGRASSWLAVAHLQMGEAGEAVKVLTKAASENPRDLALRRLLAQALVADGKPKEAVAELEAVRAAAPQDLEVVFALAGGYLRLRQIETAARLYREVALARPIPQTHMLIARAYMRYADYDQARAALRAALRADPRTPLAHYYLGLASATDSGVAHSDEAMAEFEAELKLNPGHVPSILQLGMSLVESRRPADAIPHLEIAARTDPPTARALYYLGRAQLALDRAADAVLSFRAALARAEAEKAPPVPLGRIHNQLGQAYRKLGDSGESAAHFAEAERMSAVGADTLREKLADYLSDRNDPEVAMSAAAQLLEASGVAKLAPSQRADLKRRLTAALARSYLNLGVIAAQAQDFAGAADLFEAAAGVDPGFPQVQYSLGVARFNAKQWDKATGPLGQALLATPADVELRRMLALSWLSLQAYDKAAPLLEHDPARHRDPSLQFAYGLSLIRSGRAAEAQAIFSRLIAQHGDSAEVNVVLGQAHAQAGDYESAVRVLQRAVTQKADIPGAQGTLGVIYLKQGHLPEAEAALRAELRSHPGDLASQQNLAVVLESSQKPEEAAEVLRRVLQSKPDAADALYLLGKILVSQGAATEALAHLETAARLSPEDAPIRYQLGRAYQKLGRTDDAEREFETFRTLKSKR